MNDNSQLPENRKLPIPDAFDETHTENPGQPNITNSIENDLVVCSDEEIYYDEDIPIMYGPDPEIYDDYGILKIDITEDMYGGPEYFDLHLEEYDDGQYPYLDIDIDLDEVEITGQDTISIDDLISDTEHHPDNINKNS